MASRQRYTLHKVNDDAKNSARPALMRSTTVSVQSTRAPSPLGAHLGQTGQSEDFHSTWPKSAGTNRASTWHHTGTIELQKQTTMSLTSETRKSLSARGPVPRKSYKLSAAITETERGEDAVYACAKSVLRRARHPSVYGQHRAPNDRKSAISERFGRQSSRKTRLVENQEVLELLESELNRTQEPSFSHAELSFLDGKRPATEGGQLRSNFRYKGGQTGVWSMIIENAAIEASNMRRRRVAEERAAQLKAYEDSQAAIAKAGLEAAVEGKTGEEPQLPEVSEVRQQQSKERDSTMVLLVFHRPCSPLSLDDLDVMRRAKEHVYTFDRSFVVGGIIVPMSNERILQLQGPGIKPLPFNLRVDAARKAIEQADMSSWLAVDTCEEGCLAGAPGNVVDYIRDYTRSQLFTPGIAASVLEVFSEDSLQCSSKRNDKSIIRVPMEASPRTPSGATTRQIMHSSHMRTIVVEVPKQARCEELLQGAVRALQSGQDPAQPGDTLRRLLGTNAAEVILIWAAKAQGNRVNRFQNGTSRLQLKTR